MGVTTLSKTAAFKSELIVRMWHPAISVSLRNGVGRHLKTILLFCFYVDVENKLQIK